jgi:hypothetical protein
MKDPFKDWPKGRFDEILSKIGESNSKIKNISKCVGSYVLDPGDPFGGTPLIYKVTDFFIDREGDAEVSAKNIINFTEDENYSTDNDCFCFDKKYKVYKLSKDFDPNKARISLEDLE